jgi:hypothetical protein
MWMLDENEVMRRKCTMQNLTMLVSEKPNIILNLRCSSSIYEETEGIFKESFYILLSLSKLKTKLRGLSPRANSVS